MKEKSNATLQEEREAEKAKLKEKKKDKKEKKDKEKKEKKRRRADENDNLSKEILVSPSAEIKRHIEHTKGKEESTDKEKGSKRKSDEVDSESDDDSDQKQQSKKDKKKKEKGKEKGEEVANKKEERALRRQERAKLLEQVPKADENGIAYTKQQLRRMMKRIKRGLDPIETEAEKRERLKNEADLRRNEQEELAGMLYERPDKKEGADVDEGAEGPNHDEAQEGGVDDDSDDDDDQEGDEHEDNEKKSIDAKEQALQTTKTTKKNEQSKVTEKSEVHLKKKQRRTKPVPADYTCQACQNQHKPAHWIYDCPDKVTTHRGIHDPDPRKVFVSGLPFSTDREQVKELFQTAGCTVAKLKLVMFQDTKRCKGQAFVTFATQEAAEKALSLTGTLLDNNDATAGKKKKKKVQDTSDESSPNPRPQLKLRVTKVLNRTLTVKQQKQQQKQQERPKGSKTIASS